MDAARNTRPLSLIREGCRRLRSPIQAYGIRLGYLYFPPVSHSPMLEGVDPAMVLLFGGQNRALILAALANANAPLTGYRVARLTGAQKIKVNRELQRLEEVGLVKRRAGARRSSGWVLDDPDLRGLLRRRIRVSFDSDWDLGRPGSGGAVDQLLAELERTLPDPKRQPEFYRPPGWKPSTSVMQTVREKVRPKEKDVILRKYGARPSYREGQRE